MVLPDTSRRESRLTVGRMALEDTLRNLLGWTLNHRVGGSSPSQPTYVSESEFYVQTLDVVQTLE